MIRAVLAVVVVIAMTSMAGAQVRDLPDEIIGSMSRTDASGVLRGRSAAVTRVVTWVAAVWSHQPGQADAGARDVAAWTPAALADLEIELVTLRALSRNIRRNVFPIPRAPGDVVPRQVVYSPEELKALRDLVVSIQQRGTETMLFRRAAVLHTDIALDVVRVVLPARREEPAPRGATAGARLSTTEFTDGRQRDTWRTADHWRTARLLLDQLSPGGLSLDVRDWYWATVAFTQGTEQWNLMHVAQALRRFPKDPSLLFLAGCLHEAVAAPRLSTFLERAQLPAEVTTRAGVPKDEQRVALDFFRRSLDAASSARSDVFDRYAEAETQLHYGRMLLLEGRSSDAVRTLSAVVRDLLPEPLRYDADLFLGSALEEQNRFDEAKKAYERAAMLFPAAQSPRLALSALAMRLGDRAAASDALQSLLTSGDQRERDDPWWTYHTSQARNANAALVEVRAQLADDRRAAHAP